MPKLTAHTAIWMLLVCFLKPIVYAQLPVQWSKNYGTTELEFTRHGVQTKDEGFIAVGNHWSVTGNFIDYMVVKTDKDGLMQWQKILGGTLQEYGYAVAQTNDEGFVLVGGAYSTNGTVTVNKGLQDVWIVKLDKNGNLLWEKSIGGSSIDLGEAVIATPDGGFIVGGYTSSTDGDVVNTEGTTNVWIVKFDVSGSIDWQKCYGGSKLDILSDLSNTQDGGYIFTGYSHSANGDASTNKGNADLWIVKLSSQGNVQWHKSYGGTQFDAGKDINSTQDGGYIVTGMSQSNDGDVTGNHGLMDFWIVKVNATGNLEWQQCYGGSDDDFAAGGFQATNQNYYIAGYTRSTNGQITVNKGSGDNWVLNLDATGKILWQKNYGGSSKDASSAMVPTSDGWFATVGFTSSNNGDISGNFGSEDFWIMKFGPDMKCIPTLQISPNTNNICMSSTVSIAASVSNGGTNTFYKWKVNNISTGGNVSSISSSNFRQGDRITCEYSCITACGRDTVVISNTVIINVVNDVPLTITAAADKPEICAGAEVTFTTTGLSANFLATYVWLVDGISQNVNSNIFKASLSANAKVSCIIAVTTPACAEVIKHTSNEVGVIVHPYKAPFVSIAVSADTICQGGTATFTANSNTVAAASYFWKVNGKDVSGNGATFTAASLKDKDVINCSIVLSPSAICYTSEIAISNDVVMHVKNIAAPVLHIRAPNTQACKGEALTFTAHPHNAGSITQYQWKINGSDVASGTESFTTTTLQNGDEVSCVIRSQNNLCPGSGSLYSNAIAVWVKPVPLISFSSSEVMIPFGEKATLAPKITGNPALYTWMPGQLLNDPGAASPTTLALIADKEFQVSVTDTNGCKASASIWVKVLRRIQLPTAFTPDGDGMNDVFKIPSGTLIDLHEFSIFNRWGQVVFATKNTSAGWNGKYKGDMQSGLFLYTIKGSDDKGPILIKGTVMVIR